MLYGVLRKMCTGWRADAKRVRAVAILHDNGGWMRTYARGSVATPAIRYHPFEASIRPFSGMIGLSRVQRSSSSAVVVRRR